MGRPASQITYVNLENLFFDPQNPRLPQALQGIVSEEPVITHMLRDESLVELMKSIGQTGYSTSEPLLVVPVDNGNHIVVEGNRRLAALKLLADPSKATVRRKAVEEVVRENNQTPTSIPCICYSNRDEILDYLGYRHITGVKSWGALEKARYLRQLYDRHVESVGEARIYSVLAQMIGSRRDYVAKLLTAYSLYERANENAYYGIDITEKDVDFSILSTAISYENIYNYVGLESTGDIDGKNIDDSHLAFLFTCLYDPQKKIGESRELKQLNAVIGNDYALAEYQAGSSLQIASYYTSEPLEAFQKFLADATKSLENAKGTVERISIDDDTLDLLEKKLQVIRKLAISIGGSLKELSSEDI